MKDSEKNALIEHRISKAMITIDEVEFLIRNEKLNLAVILWYVLYIISSLFKI